MALQYTLLLALALTAVAVVNCSAGSAASPDPSTTKPIPTTSTTVAPTTTPSPFKGSCNETQRQTINEIWTSIKTCFSHLVKSEDGGEKCKTNNDINNFKKPLLEALECAVNNNTRIKTEKNIAVVLSMMNTTVVKYKSLVINDTFSTCVNSNKDDIKKCVKNIKTITNGTADDLGDFSVSKNILGLDFDSASGKGELKNINDCVKEVWGKKKDCKQVSAFTEALFEIADKTAATGGASIPISSLVVMIGASLFALYF